MRRLSRAQSATPAMSGPSKPGLGESLDHVAGARRDDQLQKLGAHALARKNRETVALGDRGGEPVGVERPRGEARGKAEETQDAQIVFADALARVPDETHPPRREILEAAAVVVELSVASSESALMVKSRR